MSNQESNDAKGGSGLSGTAGSVLVRKTKASLSRHIGEWLDVDWLDDEENGHHRLIKVCPRTLLWDNGTKNTEFRTKWSDAIRITSPNNSGQTAGDKNNEHK